MRVMALDVGDVRVGIALSDPMQILASPYETYRRVGFNKDIDYILALAASQEVSVIVVGLPLKMDGTESDQTLKAKEFGNAVKEHWGGTVVFEDERLTTARARRELISDHVRRDKRKNVIDKVAAGFILQSYLERNR